MRSIQIIFALVILSPTQSVMAQGMGPFSQRLDDLEAAVATILDIVDPQPPVGDRVFVDGENVRLVQRVPTGAQRRTIVVVVLSS